MSTMSSKNNSYDAIVIGSGISGGWAAKELCEKGLKTLVLERGRDVVHLKDYPTATKQPWEFDHRKGKTLKMINENPVLNSKNKNGGYHKQLTTCSSTKKQSPRKINLSYPTLI